MKSYVINLDRSPERLAAFTQQARKAGIAFERFAAIDGKLVPEQQLAAQRADHFEFQPINRFETALFLSHRALWQKIADGSESMGAIFEDDVVLSPKLCEAFFTVENAAIPFDVVKLETTLRKVVVRELPLAVTASFSLHELKTWHGGAAAYVLSRQGARRLLDATGKLADPVDQVIFNPLSSISGRLMKLQLIPAVAIQAQFLADENSAPAFHTTAGRDAGVRFGIRHGVAIDLKRALKRLRASMRLRILALKPDNKQLRIAFASGNAKP